MRSSPPPPNQLFVVAMKRVFICTAGTRGLTGWQIRLMPVAKIAEAAEAILKQKTAPPPVSPGFSEVGGNQKAPPTKEPVDAKADGNV